MPRLSLRKSSRMRPVVVMEGSAFSFCLVNVSYLDPRHIAHARAVRISRTRCPGHAEVPAEQVARALAGGWMQMLLSVLLEIRCSTS